MHACRVTYVLLLERHGLGASAHDDLVGNLTPFVSDSPWFLQQNFPIQARATAPSGGCGVCLYDLRRVTPAMAYMPRRPGIADEQRLWLASVFATHQGDNFILHKAIIFDV